MLRLLHLRALTQGENRIKHDGKTGEMVGILRQSYFAPIVFCANRILRQSLCQVVILLNSCVT